jgi:hypothetical protein
MNSNFYSIVLVLVLLNGIESFPIGYNLTTCDLTICAGNGQCFGNVHRCQCEPGWVPPRCILDLRSSHDRYIVDVWHQVTMSLTAVILTIGVWRAILLTRSKYQRVMAQQGSQAFVLYGYWITLTLIVDSQLSCILFTSFSMFWLLLALIMGIMRGEIQHYLLHAGCACVITSVALYVRVFAMIVVKYSARTINIVKWLDRSWITYLILIAFTIVLRPLNNVQNTSPIARVMIIIHILYLLLIIIGSAVFARVVVRHAIHSMESISLPITATLHHGNTNSTNKHPVITPHTHANRLTLSTPHRYIVSTNNNPNNGSPATTASAPPSAPTNATHLMHDGAIAKATSAAVVDLSNIPSSSAIEHHPYVSPLSGHTTILNALTPTNAQLNETHAAAGGTNVLLPHATSSAYAAATTTVPTTTHNTALSRDASTSDLLNGFVPPSSQPLPSLPLPPTTPLESSLPISAVSPSVSPRHQYPQSNLSEAPTTTTNITALTPMNVSSTTGTRWAIQRDTFTTPQTTTVATSSNTVRTPNGVTPTTATLTQAPPRRTAKLRGVLRTIHSLELVGILAIVVLLVTTLWLSGTGLAFILYTWSTNYYLPLAAASLLITVMGRLPKQTQIHSSKLGGGVLSINATRSTPQQVVVVAVATAAPSSAITAVHGRTLNVPQQGGSSPPVVTK